MSIDLARSLVEHDLLLDRLLAARLHDPFSYLGARIKPNSCLVRVFYPYAAFVWIDMGTDFEKMSRIHPGGIFEWRGTRLPPMPYRLRIGEDRGEDEARGDAHVSPPRASRRSGAA